MPPPRIFGAGATTPHRGGRVAITLTDDVRTLDPAIAYDEFSLLAEHLLFDTLLDYAPAGSARPLELVPELAESYQLSADGRIYSFILRPGIQYSDGSPVVAADFAYAIDRLLTPATASPGALFFAVIEGAQAVLDGKSSHASGIRALDDRHLEFRLTAPDASFPLLLIMPFATPLKKSHVESVGAHLRTTPLSTGPFVLTSFHEGQSISFSKNPNYWNRERPYLDGVDVQLLIPRDVSVLKFLSGESDEVNQLPSDEYLRFAQTPAWQPYLSRVTLMRVFGERMDVTKPPFNDRRVRQAMNYALNKEDSVRLYNGRALIAHGMLPPPMEGYDPSIPPYPHDPTRARQLLAEAGYANGFDVTYSYAKDEIAYKLSQSIQSDLAEVGVRVRLSPMTFPAYITAVGRNELPFSFTGWTMDYPDPSNFLETKFHSKMIAAENANNDTGYSNPEVDRLLDEAHRETDHQKRLATYNRVERILHDDCPWIWHYHQIDVNVRQPYLMNAVPHPVWLRSFRDAWLDDPRSSSR